MLTDISEIIIAKEDSMCMAHAQKSDRDYKGGPPGSNQRFYEYVDIFGWKDNSLSWPMIKFWEKNTFSYLKIITLFINS